jgi:branched-chain amino acid transport system permease protein
VSNVLTSGRTPWPVLAAVIAVFALAPLVVSEFFLSVILTKALWLGVAAASLIFLAAYGGMVSLAQVGLYGIAGMTFANLVAADGGSAAEWSPWLATIAALAIATLVGLFFGALSSRSEGIYFLMITLAFSVLVYYFFSQVTELSGFGGVNNVELPALLGDPVEDAAPRYWVTLVVAALVFLGLRAIARTPFGLVLQGQRDEPARMRALGFDVLRHRTLAFALAALIAAIAGVLSVWYNRRISPGSINLAQTIDVLIIAVIGGLYRLEGAWVGALVYALIDNYSRDWVPDVGNVLGPARFNTVIGLVFLIIVLASPNGLMGLGQNAWDRLRRRGAGTGRPPPGTGAGLAEQPARGAVN